MSFVLTLLKFQPGYGKEVGETIFWAIFGQQIAQKITKKTRYLQLFSVSWNCSLGLEFETLDIKVPVLNVRLWI